jgi:hypothetical protein
MIRTRFGGGRINCGLERPSLSNQPLPERWVFPTIWQSTQPLLFGWLAGGGMLVLPVRPYL